MEDTIGQLRLWICEQIENVEATFEAPGDLGHVDGEDCIEVLEYVKQHIDEMCDYAYDEDEDAVLD